VKRAVAALALGAATAALAAAPAAGQGTGTTTIAPKGKAVKTLRSQGVRIGTFGPARARRGRLVLPVEGGLVSSTATLNQNGGLRLTRRAGGKRRRVDLKRLQLRLGRESKIVGYIGTSRFTLFSVKAPASRLRLSAANGSASLKGGRLSLTRRAGKAIKRRLRLRSGSGPGGGPGGGPPVSGPVGNEPPYLARPAGAVDVTSASIDWHVRPSWIRYVPVNDPFGGATGEGPTPTGECGEPSEPAHPDVYEYHFPFAHGWYHQPSGTAAVYFTGGVNFKFQAHGIDLDTKDPEIEVNGASSRAIFRFDGRGDTNPGNKRGVLVDLAPGTPSVSGQSVTWDRMPGTIPEDGGSQSVFAGFYLPGERFGCVSLTLGY
jgi:hypothetical protein